MTRVTVAQDKCISSGMCVLTAPDVFDQREYDGVVRLLVERPAADRLAAVQEAVEQCPASVIWIDEDG